MEQKPRAAVFIDQEMARLITLKEGFAAFSGSIQSNIDLHPRYHGEGSNQTRFGTDPYHGSNNEYHKNKQEAELKKAYFSHLEEVLLPYSAILLIGPGEMKKEFCNYLLNQKKFQDRKIELHSIEHKSDKQLLELARVYFNLS
jgi:hypothetical protein